MLFKTSIMQKRHHLLDRFTIKQHPAMAERQNDMIAHIRTMRFSDQNRAIMFAMQT